MSENYPDNYRSYYHLGELYKEMGEFLKAKEQYEIASLIEPNFNEIKLKLALIESKFGDYNLTIKKLIDLAKDNKKTRNEKCSIYCELYTIYEIIGQLNKSIEFARKANELDPT